MVRCGVVYCVANLSYDGVARCATRSYRVNLLKREVVVLGRGRPQRGAPVFLIHQASAWVGGRTHARLGDTETLISQGQSVVELRHDDITRTLSPALWWRQVWGVCR